MQIEQLEIPRLPAPTRPSTRCPTRCCSAAAAVIDVRYYKAGEPSSSSAMAEFWHLVRSGAVEVFRRNGTLYNRPDRRRLLRRVRPAAQRAVRFPVVALEDTLIYLIPREVFAELFDQHEAFADYVEVEDKTRLRQAMSRKETPTTCCPPRWTLVGRAAVTLDSTATVREVAQRMTEEACPRC